MTGTTQDKSKVKIWQHFVAFSEYMNFTYVLDMTPNFVSQDSFLLNLIDLAWLMQKENYPGKPIFQSQGLN